MMNSSPDATDPALCLAAKIAKMKDYVYAGEEEEKAKTAKDEAKVGANSPHPVLFKKVLFADAALIGPSIPLQMYSSISFPTRRYQVVITLNVPDGTVQATTTVPKPESARKLPVALKKGAVPSKEAASKPAKAAKSSTPSQKRSSSAKEEKPAVRKKRKHEPVTVVADDDDDDNFVVSASLKGTVLCSRHGSILTSLKSSEHVLCGAELASKKSCKFSSK